MLLGFLRGVGVVEVGFVAADDVAWVGHFGGMGGWIEIWWDGICGWRLNLLMKDGRADEVDALVRFRWAAFRFIYGLLETFGGASSSMGRLDFWRDQATLSNGSRVHTATSCRIDKSVIRQSPLMSSAFKYGVFHITPSLYPLLPWR